MTENIRFSKGEINLKVENKKHRDPFKGLTFPGKPVSKSEYIEAYESYVNRCSSKQILNSDCDIRETAEGVFINGVKQTGVKDLQVKKNSHQLIEVQVDYLATSFSKEKFCYSSRN